MNRHAFDNDALASIRGPRPVPREPSRGFLIALALVGLIGPVLALMVGGF